MKRKLAILFVVALLVVVNFSIWSYINNPLQLQPWTKTTMGVTYDPMRKQDTQTGDSYPSEADMDSDLALLANKVHAVRTYSMLKGQHKIPELAAKLEPLDKIPAGDLCFSYGRASTPSVIR